MFRIGCVIGLVFSVSLLVTTYQVSPASARHAPTLTDTEVMCPATGPLAYLPGGLIPSKVGDSLHTFCGKAAHGDTWVSLVNGGTKSFPNGGLATYTCGSTDAACLSGQLASYPRSKWKFRPPPLRGVVELVSPAGYGPNSDPTIVMTSTDKNGSHGRGFAFDLVTMRYESRKGVLRSPAPIPLSTAR